ncbi:hypothetical protein CLU90_5796 [Janthinobacterium sp. 67]|nr:hypothetical protein CLU90_5796 [Janthinobacterium sp. 67]
MGNMNKGVLYGQKQINKLRMRNDIIDVNNDLLA